MKQLLVFSLIFILAACGQSDDTEELDGSEEPVAESEPVEEDDSEETAAETEETEVTENDDSAESAEETGEESDNESEAEVESEETGNADGTEENTDADEPIEITPETVLAEEEGTDVDGGTSVLEEELTEYIEETGIENLTSENLYNKAIEIVGGHPDTMESIEFFNSFDPELDINLTNMPGGLEVDGDSVLLNNNIYILLDNSSSMLGEVNGDTKMEVARTAVDNFASDFPEGVEVSLINYGYGDEDGTDANSCEAIETTYPLGEYENDGFNEALNKFEPVGYTPIAAAIEAVGKQIEGSDAAGSHTVYIVSDGKETCEGDPVAAVENLPQDDNVETVLNIIGFDISDDEVQDLVDITEASGGEYLEAANTVELENALQREKTRLINDWTRWSNENLNAIVREYNSTSNERVRMSNQGMNSSTRTTNALMNADTRLANKYHDEELPSFSEYAEERNGVLQEFFSEHGEDAEEVTEESYEERRTEVETMIEENREEFVDEELEDAE